MMDRDELERASDRVHAIFPAANPISDKDLIRLADLIEDQEAKLRGTIIRILKRRSSKNPEPAARLFSATEAMVAKVLKQVLHSLWQNDNEPPDALDESADALCRQAIDFGLRKYALLTAEVLGVEHAPDTGALSRFRKKCIGIREQFKQNFRANRLGHCGKCFRYFRLSEHRDCPYCSGAFGTAQSTVVDPGTAIPNAQPNELAGTATPNSPCSKKSTFGQNIDKLRKECGWSFETVARKTGLDKTLIIGHVNHGKGARRQTVTLYADAFTKELGRPILAAELYSKLIEDHS